ncbi:metalloprotease family protein [Oleiagrimonas sp. MCCC 1A03011]|uniref:metalloprotease family protein n=1 Tax=Oleiagrimonas sp. MCCC 1A03011 TaxID=1926883 RepID=UPI000DC2FBB1|nr:metalloprotease family protein [Oleiagrimonas sp. MCCC 1A03011]RAP59720.1 hypothetical protein BTJ49_03550 [Oleiagrimonas sp. MCCC 1A03011]
MRQSMSRGKFAKYSQLLGLVLSGIFILIYMSFRRDVFSDVVLSFDIIMGFIFILAVSIFIHEYIHYASFTFNGGADKGLVDYRFSRKALTPYVVCRDKVKACRYMVSAILPFLLLGVLLFIISIVYGSRFVFWLSVYQIYGSSGDLLLFFMLTKFDASRFVVRTVGEVGFETL